MTVFTQPAYTFSESSYFNLKFGIKESKICQKFGKQWLTKGKISELADDQQADFFKNAPIESSRIALSKFTGA